MTPEAERFNGCAMLGFVAAVGAYVTTDNYPRLVLMPNTDSKNWERNNSWKLNGRSNDGLCCTRWCLFNYWSNHTRLYLTFSLNYAPDFYKVWFFFVDFYFLFYFYKYVLNLYWLIKLKCFILIILYIKF